LRGSRAASSELDRVADRVKDAQEFGAVKLLHRAGRIIC